MVTDDDFTPAERARLRALLAVAPVLEGLAASELELEAAANERPSFELARVDDDGALLVTIGCARRITDIAEGRTPPSCAWLPLEGIGHRCRECRRVEAGGARAARLDLLSGSSGPQTGA